MGENGAGKSTLLKMIAGALAPDAGDAAIGAVGHAGLLRAARDGRPRPATAPSSRSSQEHAPLANQGTLRSLAGAFGFHDDDVFKPVRVLSGGEKARLALAKLLYDAPNLLVLDEPTNHLDIVTKRALVTALADYEGTLVFVSHDRQFLRALANRVLELSAGRPADLRRQLRRVRRLDRPRGPGHARGVTAAPGAEISTATAPKPLRCRHQRC